MWIYRFASPRHFDALCARLIPVTAVLAVLCGAAGAYVGFVLAPPDYRQGEVYRILYLHVPAAWMGLLIYAAMGVHGAFYLGFQTRLSGLMQRALAPTGAIMTALGLLTGMLWGQPTWGTWWVWDARLTSTAILLLLYIGHLTLTRSIDDPVRADRAASLLSLVGVLWLPVIWFSVQWWNTLHQGASISLSAAPRMAQTMLWGLALSTAAAWLYCIAIVLWRARVLIARHLQERRQADQAAHDAQARKASTAGFVAAFE